MESNDLKTEVGIYRRCAMGVPEKYDDYIVKTNKGTYEFAHYNIDGWHIKGDNGGESVEPIAWTLIPTTPIKE